MPRFFTDSAPKEGRIILSGEDARHISKSLRMQPGETITICNGKGTDFHCVLLESTIEKAYAQIQETHPSLGEPTVQVSLYMALPKADKMDFIIQKATELGVSEIVPVLTSRCVSRPDAQKLEKKNTRWAKIATEAAKQCGRGCIPAVFQTLSFENALSRAAMADVSIICYECEHGRRLKAVLQQTTLTSVSVFIGAEGGFAPEEVLAAKEAGLISVSLGPRILRCETAPLAVLTAIMYESGNL